MELTTDRALMKVVPEVCSLYLEMILNVKTFPRSPKIEMQRAKVLVILVASWNAASDEVVSCSELVVFISNGYESDFKVEKFQIVKTNFPAKPMKKIPVLKIFMQELFNHSIVTLLGVCIKWE